MSSTTIDNVEHFSLDGPFGLPVAIALLIPLLLLFTWSLQRERRVLGTRHSVLFWLLRVSALATAVWMLLAPATVLVQTSTTRQAVAIVTDVSGSMQTVDPPGTADDLRWAAAQHGSSEGTALRAADSAVAAAGIAEQHLRQAADALTQHQRESLVVEATQAAADAIRRISENLTIVVAQLHEKTPAAGPSAKSTLLATRLRNSMDGPEFKDFFELTTALAKGRTPSQKGWRESLPDLQHRVAGLRRQLRELSRGVSQQNSAAVAAAAPATLTALQQQTRLSRVAGLLQSLQSTVLSPILETADVRPYAFDRSVRRLQKATDPASEVTMLAGPSASADQSQSSSQDGTNLSAVLEQLNRERTEQPLAAAFILTDAAHNRNTAANPRDAAADLNGTPVYVIPIGNTQHVRDVIIQSVFVPNVAMRNDDIVIEATLQAHDCEGESCFVQLLHNGEEIDQRVVELDSGFATRKLRFERKMAEVGTQHFQIAVAPLEGELTDKNNFDDFDVTVTRSDIKLLLADELPRWEYRYLAQLFRRDPNVECDELLFEPRLIATGRRQENGTFPTTVDDWDQYDVVILGDIPPTHFSAAAQESLVDYLKHRGGTVMLIAGEEAMPQAFVDHPLEAIVPVSPATGDDVRAEAGYAFHVTEQGRDQDALMIGETEEATRIAWDFINQVSPIYRISSWSRPRATARTLIAAVPRGMPAPVHGDSQKALLCWQPVGRGMAVYLSAPDTWRLRLLRGDRLHFRFWGQLLRWAVASDLSAGSETVRIRSDKSRYSSDETVQVAVRLTDGDGQPVTTADLQAVVRHDSNERSAPLVPDDEIPGQYTAELRGLPPGVYSLQAIGDEIDRLLQDSGQEISTSSFTVQAELPLEILDTRSDRALAQQIADITGGQVLPPTAVDEVLRLTNLEPLVSEQIENKPLWLQWKFLWIVFGCLQTEWIIRKWKGLS
ncbi:MAG: hypothetical protein RIK87_15755 [Fuerstiella sp.]